MRLRTLRHKLLLTVGIALALAFSGVAYFYTSYQEKMILTDYERSLQRVTNSVTKGLESVMLEGHAEIMREYSKRLRALRDVSEFVILRADGSEAFRDNATVSRVNERLGAENFPLYPQPVIRKNLDPADAEFQRALLTLEATAREITDSKGQRQFIFFDPIPTGPGCQRCHGSDERVRGVIKVTSSLAGVEAAIFRVRLQSMLIITLAMALTMAVTGYMLGRSVVHPIEAITRAMKRILSGDIGSTVPLQGGGEIRQMAESFNQMTASLKLGYDLLVREREKLTTIIHAAREAIVVTDAAGSIVLINPAAAELLGKTEANIRDEGFLHLLDNPELMERLLAGAGQAGHTETVAYRDRVVLVSAASIKDEGGRPLGSAALIRDVTDEKRMIEELRRVSITDALTGVFNRRHMDTTLSTEFGRVQRSGKPLSVLLFDIDHFKKFNDTHGHDQGDRVLQAVGQAMKAVVRKYDTPCRYGGEEFVIILPEADRAGALSVGERLRRDVEAMLVDGLHVTISLGAATFPELALSKAEQLVEAADAALYQAKEEGRNRLVVAEGPAT
ncbi:diguanylate cyclase [Denitratisoma oestradiolicum]|uniref:diguanylate cyclase n=1 Tax=Denitratisoma oestradiolicum TaxID=311182 RepID=A0A6S6YI35_9PROT|nr:diguanylate cyclase [Denitratisoma oestradiolicum]CAB1367404.1 Diguanylate cyclase with PAS/PAC sensor [Denitratisoma oestradiolicum]